MNTISHIIIIVTNFQILVSVLNPLSPKKTPVEEPVEDQTQPTITLEVSTTRLSDQCVTQTHDCYQVPGFTYPTGCLSPIMEMQTPLATPCPSPLPTPLLTRLMIMIGRMTTMTMKVRCKHLFLLHRWPCMFIREWKWGWIGRWPWWCWWKWQEILAPVSMRLASWNVRLALKILKFCILAQGTVLLSFLTRGRALNFDSLAVVKFNTKSCVRSKYPRNV